MPELRAARRLVAPLALVAAASLAALAASPTADGGRSPKPFACPVVPAASSLATPEAVLRAARRLVPVEYAGLRSGGAVAWRGFQFGGVVSLRRTEYAPELYRLAAGACGRTVAERSWAVLLEFPRCDARCSRDTAFLAFTRLGWRIWYSGFRHP